jgi:hypothetical protein
MRGRDGKQLNSGQLVSKATLQGATVSIYYSNLLGRRVRGIKLLGIWVPLSRR